VPCQSPSMEKRNSAVPVASMEERCAVPVATLHAGGSEVAGAGNLRSRLAAAGQNIQGGSAPASGAASAQRAHNGVDDGRLAVAKCIKILETLIHMGATIDSVDVGQCQAPSRALSRLRARESVSKQCPAPSQAPLRSRAGEGGSRRCVQHALPEVFGDNGAPSGALGQIHLRMSLAKIVAGHISRQKSSSANPSIPGSPPFTLSPFPLVPRQLKRLESTETFPGESAPQRGSDSTLLA
jgi:hypothetical protein